MRTQTASAETLYQEILASVKDDIRFSQLQPWLRHLAVESCEDGILSLRFDQRGLNELFSTDLSSLLQEAAHLLDPNLSIYISAEKSASPAVPAATPVAGMTFDTFQGGGGNRLALAAARRVVENPAADYNPLFIHAPSGLGKTHLLNAIHNSYAAAYPGQNVLHLRAGDLIRNFRPGAERDAVTLAAALNHASLFLLDDLHLFENAGEYESLLLYAFEEAHSAGAQIVISADKNPLRFGWMGESLRSRLQWGLVVEMEAPSAEMRRELLAHLALKLGLQLPGEVVAFLAENTYGNFREMEGIVRKLHSLDGLAARQIDLTLARKTVREYSNPIASAVNIRAVETAVCEHFNLDHNRLSSKTRIRSIAYPRQVAMHLAQSMTSNSLEEIGKYFGGRDHSTVKHGCDKIKAAAEKDPALRKLLHDIRKKILAS